MSKIITADNGQQYQTQSKGKTFGAIMAGSMASSAVASASSAVTLPSMNKMKKLSQSCDTVQLRSAIQSTFKDGLLPAKGVEFIDIATPTKETNLIDNILKILQDKKVKLSDLHSENKPMADAIQRAIPKWLRNPYNMAKLEMMVSALERGDNACYLPKGKKVIVNTEKLGLSAFHEMGHAINHNCTKFWKVMQGARGPMKLLGGTLAMTALCKRKKLEGEEPKGIFDKATTFVKNNVGKLVTLSFVPMVAEELMASRRGNKMAAKVLSPDMLKKVKMSNRLGALTYVTAAIVSGAAARIASNVRDKIAAPKEV